MSYVNETEINAFNKLLLIKPENRNYTMWMAIIQHICDKKAYEAAIVQCNEWLSQPLISDHEICTIYVKKTSLFEKTKNIDNAILSISEIIGRFNNNQNYVIQSHVNYAKQKLLELYSKK